VIRESVAQLAAQGVRANHLQIKYILPFHAEAVRNILSRARRTICVEGNATGQFARHLRAETGIGVDELILKYDGEPFEPRQITEQVLAILEGRPRTPDVTLPEAREIAYHYIRTHLSEDVRPGKIEKMPGDGIPEPVWCIQIVDRDTGDPRGELFVGVETGSTYSWQPARLRARSAKT
jgi:hypothetical protein